jgi:hypothetical protein
MGLARDKSVFALIAFGLRYPQKESGLGSLLVIILLTQKLVSSVGCQYKRLKGRFASALV